MAVEGKFGQGKRRYDLNRVMGRLAESRQTVVSIIFLVMNLEQLLTVHFLRLLERFISALEFSVGVPFSNAAKRHGDICLHVELFSNP
uniref:Transposase DDE domain-containing protein n=1 Tax=Chlorobium phaeobacteroides (strain BS1) TaxID=331678 RepID=B3EJW6_CHLPB